MKYAAIFAILALIPSAAIGQGGFNKSSVERAASFRYSHSDASTILMTGLASKLPGGAVAEAHPVGYVSANRVELLKGGGLHGISYWNYGELKLRQTKASRAVSKWRPKNAGERKARADLRVVIRKAQSQLRRSKSTLDGKVLIAASRFQKASKVRREIEDLTPLELPKRSK